MASTAKRAATKRIESLLSMFLLLTTGELIAAPPLIVRVTISRFSPKSKSSLRLGLWLRHRIVELRDQHAFVRTRVVAERLRPLHQDFLRIRPQNDHGLLDEFGKRHRPR